MQPTSAGNRQQHGGSPRRCRDRDRWSACCERLLVPRLDRHGAAGSDWGGRYPLCSSIRTIVWAAASGDSFTPDTRTSGRFGWFVGRLQAGHSRRLARLCRPVDALRIARHANLQRTVDVDLDEPFDSGFRPCAVGTMIGGRVEDHRHARCLIRGPRCRDDDRSTLEPATA